MHFHNWKELFEVMPESNKQQKQCGMEQLVARRAHNPKVVGSSPAPATQEVKSLKSKDLRLFCLMIRVDAQINLF